MFAAACAVAALLATIPAPHVARGDQVDAAYHAYREKLERFFARFGAALRTDAPDLEARLQEAPPKPVPHGWGLLPKIVPDGPAPANARATSVAYGWPRTQAMVDTEAARLVALIRGVASATASPANERRRELERRVAEAQVLSSNQKLIDAHVHYNRLWQAAIAADRAGFDRNTQLHDLVLEQQAIKDALGAPDEAAFRKALTTVHDLDAAAPRPGLEPVLRARAEADGKRIHEAASQASVPGFVSARQVAPGRWVLRLPIVTDVEDRSFLRDFQAAVERVWRLRDNGARVVLELRRIAPSRLYAESPACKRERSCTPPARGAEVDLDAHAARFPEGAAVLTTGAGTTHVRGRTLFLGPAEIARNVLAHEVGHLLGFNDTYFRGYRDRGAEGFEVLEVVPDPEDLMSAPGTGKVERAHFERLLAARPSPGR